MTKSDFEQFEASRNKIYNDLQLSLVEKFEIIGSYTLDDIVVIDSTLEVYFSNEYRDLGFSRFYIEIPFKDLEVDSIEQLIIDLAAKEFANQIEIKRKAQEEYAKRVEKDNLKKEREDFLKARELYLKLKEKYESTGVIGKD